MTHRRWPFILAVFLLAGAAGLAATIGAAPNDGSQPEPLAPQATPTVPQSACAVGARKWVDPDSLVLGQSADVTLVVTHTCPFVPLPIDMVVIADQSYSMTRGQGGGNDPVPTKPPEPMTPDPSQPPPTKPAPGQTPGTGPGCFPPPFCGGPGDIRTAEPTATPTRWWQKTPTPRVKTPEPTPIQEHAGSEDRVRDIRQWVGDFLGDPIIEGDFASGRLRMGYVGFNRRAVIRQNLSDDPSDVQSSANRMRGADITNIRDALREAERILNGPGSRADGAGGGRLKVVMILSDFQFCTQDVQRMSPEITVITVGFGVDRCDSDKLQRMASGREWVFEQARPADVIAAYDGRLARGGRSVTLAEVAIRDDLANDMTLVWDSWQPPTATVRGQLIEWPIPAPGSPVTASFGVRPARAGLLPVSVMAEAVYTDTLGLSGRVVFPEVSIDVVAHTATPTATHTPTPTPTTTPTATPTATPTPAARYLPLVRKRWPPPEPTQKPCVPEEQTIDVALVVDTSTSMRDPTHAGGQPKLDAAIEAARLLVSLLKAEDQAAIVSFNNEASLLQPLTSDRPSIDEALGRLPETQGMGTSIYRGLATARDELLGPRHKSENNRSIVLVTDGQHNDPEHGLDAVRALAVEIRAADIEIVTVGLGSDIDEDLLRDIASLPAYFFRAPDAADLLDIYREIAHLIPCP